MKRWFEQRKPVMIFLGIVYIILALFVVSAYVKNSVDYVQNIGSSETKEENKPIWEGEGEAKSETSSNQ